MTSAPYKIRRPPRCHPTKLDWNEQGLIQIYRDLSREEQRQLGAAAYQAWQAARDAGRLVSQAPALKRKPAGRVGNLIELFPQGRR